MARYSQLPSRDFPKPLKLSKCAGYLLLLSLLSSWAGVLTLCYLSLLLGLGCKLTACVVTSLATPLALLIYVWTSYVRWKTCFVHLHDRDDRRNITFGKYPTEADLGVVDTAISMRPTRMEFSDYLWCALCISPFFGAHAYYSIASMAGVKWLYWLGCIETASAAEILATFFLESSTAIFWFDRIQDGGCGAHQAAIAVFTSDFYGDEVEVPKVGGGLVALQRLQVRVDLKQRRAIDASCGGRPISCEDCLLVVMYLALWKGHAHVHGLATWGVDTKATDAWLARMSVCSLYFNHLGGDGGAVHWKSAVNSDIEPLDLPSKLPFQRPGRDFGRLEQLLPYSRFLSFVDASSTIFFRLLKEQKQQHGGPETASSAEAFAAMDPMAHYHATFLHSLDHWMLHRAFDEKGKLALLFRGNRRSSREEGEEADFRTMSDLSTFAFAISDDWPKLFSVYMRQSSHPFYRRVYEECLELDPELAFHVQCCIIK